MISAEFSIQKHTGDVSVFTDSLLLPFQWAQKCYKCEWSLWWRLRWAAESYANSRARQIFQLVNWKSQIDKRATVPEVTLHAETAPLQNLASHPVPALKIAFSVLAWSQAPRKVGCEEAARHPLGCLRCSGIGNLYSSCFTFKAWSLLSSAGDKPSDFLNLHTAVNTGRWGIFPSVMLDNWGWKASALCF